MNQELLDFYKSIGIFRKDSNVFIDGEFVPIYNQNCCVSYLRKKDNNIVFTAVNMGENDIFFPLPFNCEIEKSLYGNIPKDGWIAVGKEDICIFSGKIKP